MTPMTALPCHQGYLKVLTLALGEGQPKQGPQNAKASAFQKRSATLTRPKNISNHALERGGRRMNINDEAIEAAAKGIWDVDRSISDREYEDCQERTKRHLRREATAALEAAIPHLGGGE